MKILSIITVFICALSLSLKAQINDLNKLTEYTSNIDTTAQETDQITTQIEKTLNTNNTTITSEEDNLNKELINKITEAEQNYENAKKIEEEFKSLYEKSKLETTEAKKIVDQMKSSQKQLEQKIQSKNTKKYNDRSAEIRRRRR